MTKSAELSCPTCGEMVYLGEGFCEACGHRLMDGVPDPPGGGNAAGTGGPGATSSPPCTGCGEAAIDADGYCEHCGLRQPAGRDHIEIELAGGGAGDGAPVAAGASDRGKRYSRNEDAIALAAIAGGVAAVVSDGVGSSPNPDDASRAAADTGAAELTALLEAGHAPEDATRAAALKAAEAVAALAPSPSEAPSCTYVSAVTGPSSVTVGWIGDSRAYWLPPTAGVNGDAPGATESGATAPDTTGPDTTGPDTTGPDVAGPDVAGPDVAGPEGSARDVTEEDGTEPDTEDVTGLGPPRRLTDDDSWAEIMVAQGALTEAEAEAHPNAHVITAWLGADAEEVRPHVATFTPRGPGTLLVCSDGLWNYFPAAADLAALLTGPAGDPAADPLGAARTLVQHALNAGGRDNVTVAVIPFRGAPSTPDTSTEHDR